MSEAPTSAVQAAYDLWADSYDSVENATRDLDAAVLRAQGFALAEATAIEAGCGTGKNSVWLAERARALIAFDFSEAMLDRARRALDAAQFRDRARLLRHDIVEPWPVAEAGADLVIIDLVLEHVANLAPVFAHAHRALKRGGRLFLCELHPFRQWLGKQARFHDRSTGAEIRIPAFPHAISDFVNTSIAQGFTLARLDEWRDPGASTDTAPRLLSLNLEKN